MPQLARQTESSLSEINIVPFVDVMLVLLVIFMITAPILQSGIEVDVPKTKTVKEISESRVVVSIDRAQRIYIGDDAVNIHELGIRCTRRCTTRNPIRFIYVAIRRCRSERSPRWWTLSGNPASQILAS